MAGPSQAVNTSYEDRIARLEEDSKQHGERMAALEVYQKSLYGQVKDLKNSVDIGFSRVNDKLDSMSDKNNVSDNRLGALETKQVGHDKFSDAGKKILISILIAAGAAFATNYLTANKPVVKAAVQAAVQALAPN